MNLTNGRDGPLSIDAKKEVNTILEYARESSPEAQMPSAASRRYGTFCPGVLQTSMTRRPILRGR